MRAVILAGGEGTRLRPLTLALPKPVVPVVDRPFLRFQLDLLGRVGVEDVVFSIAYRPDRVRAVFGDGSSLGKRIRYAVEETPLGTGGAVKNAEPWLDETTIVFNGDVLTDVDLPAVVERHRRTRAAATLVLTPVPNPAAYGLVETDPDGRVRRFVEKPDPSQITTDTINAGIYVLDASTLGLMPPAVNHSIERAFFPALLARGDRVTAHVHRGYWIDIGTPEKYLQAHRDILGGRFPVALDGRARSGGWVHGEATVEEGAELQGPCYVGPRCRVAAGARLGAGAVLTAGVSLDPGAHVADSVLWEGTRVGAGARVEGALLGQDVQVGERATVGPGAVLGQGTAISAFSRTREGTPQ
ncbi:MAG TPA: NDP-sugar synthase [Vicinamibacteria bacterium]|nr:NDP-sugar synthase [Vicinamibacteria bacterium]